MSTKTAEFYEKEYADLQRSNTIITIIYVVFTFFIMGYLIWGTQQLSQARNPQFLAQLVRYQVEESILPGAEPQVEEFLLNGLPQVFDQFLGNTSEQIPTIRKNAVDSLIRTSSFELDKLQNKSLAAFEAILDRHDIEVKAALQDFENPEQREALKQTMKTIIREQYSENVQKDVKEIVKTFSDLAQNYTHLLTTSKADLTLRELEKRHVLLLAIAYMHDVAKSDVIKKIAP